MSIAAWIVGVAGVLGLGGLLWILTRREKPGFSAKDARDWNEAERQGQGEREKAEKKAAERLKAIGQKEEEALGSIDARTKKNTQEDLQKDPDKALQDAIARYDQTHGIQGLILLLLPFLLQACTFAHGSGAGVTKPSEYVTIKRSTWEKAIDRINDCSGKLEKCKKRRQADQDKAEVQCGRRTSAYRADLEVCRKQRGILQKKTYPSCLGWQIAAGVLGGVAAAAIVTTFVAIFSPDTFQGARQSVGLR